MFDNMKKNNGFAIPCAPSQSAPVPKAPIGANIPVVPVMPGFANYGNQSKSDKEKDLMRMDEKLVRTVEKYNIDGIENDYALAQSQGKPLSEESVLKLLKKLPRMMYSLRLECVKRLSFFENSAAYTHKENESYASITVRNCDADSIMENHIQESLNIRSAEYKLDLYCYILRFLFENINDKKLSEEELSELLCVYESVNVHRFVNIFADLVLGYGVRPYKYGELDFRYYFHDLMDLLYTAYEAGQDIAPYVYAVKGLHDVFTTGLSEIHFCGLDHNYLYLNKKECHENDLEKLFIPVKVCAAAVFYSYSDAEFIFESVCNTDILNNNPRILDFLCEVVDHTDFISKKQCDRLLEIVGSVEAKIDGDGVTDNEFVKSACKEECLIYLRHSFSRRLDRESVYKI